MSSKFWISAVLLLAVTGCKKEETREEPSAPVVQPAEKPSAPVAELPLAPDVPTTKLGELPIAEDLEEEAARTIVVDNLEAELDRLEAEILGTPR